VGCGGGLVDLDEDGGGDIRRVFEVGCYLLKTTHDDLCEVGTVNATMPLHVHILGDATKPRFGHPKHNVVGRVVGTIWEGQCDYLLLALFTLDLGVGGGVRTTEPISMGSFFVLVRAHAASWMAASFLANSGICSTGKSAEQVKLEMSKFRSDLVVCSSWARRSAISLSRGSAIVFV